MFRFFWLTKELSIIVFRLLEFKMNVGLQKRQVLRRYLTIHVAVVAFYGINQIFQIEYFYFQAIQLAQLER